MKQKQFTPWINQFKNVHSLDTDIAKQSKKLNNKPTWMIKPKQQIKNIRKHKVSLPFINTYQKGQNILNQQVSIIKNQSKKVHDSIIDKGFIELVKSKKKHCPKIIDLGIIKTSSDIIQSRQKYFQKLQNIIILKRIALQLQIQEYKEIKILQRSRSLTIVMSSGSMQQKLREKQRDSKQKVVLINQVNIQDQPLNNSDIIQSSNRKFESIRKQIIEMRQLQQTLESEDLNNNRFENYCQQSL